MIWEVPDAKLKGVPGIHVLCLDASFQHGPQNRPSVCPGGRAAHGKKHPENRKGDKGRDGGRGGEPTVPSVCSASLYKTLGRDAVLPLFFLPGQSLAAQRQL